ncbi:MAG: orotidine-5'-phosphate decarboxylase [Candidatus Nanoarchaeia archaeon]
MIPDKIIEAIDKVQNPSVVGLDPKFEKLPEFLKRQDKADAILKFNKLIIDSIKDVVPIVKPQAAYYEALGVEGIKALSQTIKYAKEKGLIVIVDAKRNDIGSTAEAYAESYFGETSLECDLLTVNPYLGTDGIKPFIKKAGEHKGIFVLVKTSNPSSGEFQDKNYEGKKMYELVAEKVNELARENIGKSGYSSVGAVIGATYKTEAESLRKIMPNSIFLVPGYGKQGGTADDAVVGFNGDGYGAVVNSSRGVIYNFNENANEEEFKESIKQAALKMREDLQQAMKRANKFPWD